ncbi:RSP_2648 family PIN domain-containing protein [Paracoccus contaminans]|uniref:PIN domain-containing protein n=1 Tax=Paracoccus contaminans TaxID=1945662 RepID=A0A1W6CYD6_9RHOB|nr:PIN domain-containing protein [Paracoccus contaminans]ARJ69870.1 PIN domain-containing protein [Paracoccus contaminans]
MKAVLDACVLYPTVLREIVIGTAGAGLFQPVWSARILAEWRRAAARLGPAQADVAGAEIALLSAAWPQAEASGEGSRAAGHDWPDPADRHVAEAALAGDAALIVTANLADFPRRVLADLGLAAVHPDAFLLSLYRSDPAPVAAAVGAAHERAERLGGPVPLRALLARARLPRLSKALGARPDGGGAGLADGLGTH